MFVVSAGRVRASAIPNRERAEQWGAVRSDQLDGFQNGHEPGFLLLCLSVGVAAQPYRAWVRGSVLPSKCCECPVDMAGRQFPLARLRRSVTCASLAKREAVSGSLNGLGAGQSGTSAILCCGRALQITPNRCTQSRFLARSSQALLCAAWSSGVFRAHARLRQRAPHHRFYTTETCLFRWPFGLISG